jgi:hypothetical protein
VPRTQNDEFNTAQSPVLNNNQNYHPRKYTCKNIHTVTRKVSDARGRSRLLTKKLNRENSAFQMEHITSKYSAVMVSADNIAITNPF